MMQAIQYKGQTIEVEDADYKQWEEDIAKGVWGTTLAEQDARMVWTTYHFLINNGYFVDRPDVAEPVDVVEEEYIAPSQAEPKWTKERILKERASLLRQSEKLFEEEKRHMRKQYKDMLLTSVKPKQTPSKLDSLLTITTVILIIIVVMIICRNH